MPADVTGSYSTTKCLTCDRKKINKISIISVARRNKVIIAILAGFWLFTVYPLPFLQMMGYKIDATAFQPVLFATAAMTIPFVFMFIAWQKRSPKSDEPTQSDYR